MRKSPSVCVAFLVCLWPIFGFGQQVLQRGALGAPAQVLDDTQQWTTPLLVAGDAEVEVYIPDVSNTE